MHPRVQKKVQQQQQTSQGQTVPPPQTVTLSPNWQIVVTPQLQGSNLNYAWSLLNGSFTFKAGVSPSAADAIAAATNFYVANQAQSGGS